MTEIKAKTLQLAKETGAEQGTHVVDGRDLVSAAGGWFTNQCAAAADAGGGLPEMTFALMNSMEGWGTPAEQKFAGLLCADIAAEHPAAPGDAIRDAPLDGLVPRRAARQRDLMHVRMNGQRALDSGEKERLEGAFGRVLLREW